MAENSPHGNEQPTLFESTPQAELPDRIIVTRKFQWQYRTLNALIVLFFGLFTYLFYQTTLPLFIGKKNNEHSQLTFPKTVQVDILNASGVAGIGMKLTKQLREFGVDVIDVGNFSSEVEKSFIIDRIGNREHAKALAKLVELDSSNIVQQISHEYLVNLSLVVGKDYQRFFQQKFFNNK